MTDNTAQMVVVGGCDSVRFHRPASTVSSPSAACNPQRGRILIPSEWAADLGLGPCPREECFPEDTNDD